VAVGVGVFVGVGVDVGGGKVNVGWAGVEDSGIRVGSIAGVAPGDCALHAEFNITNAIFTSKCQERPILPIFIFSLWGVWSAKRSSLFLDYFSHIISL
jgi:hypothetical protein